MNIKVLKAYLKSVDGKDEPTWEGLKEYNARLKYEAILVELGSNIGIRGVCF